MAKKLVIVLIFLLAFFLRTWNLSKYPVSLSMDEAAIGYNAYSILKTGHDEYKEFLPLTFRSAGDYKPPVDFYLTVPSIFLFGLTEFSIRLPVALVGSLTAVAFIYLLINLGLSFKASAFGGFWLAVLPWHIHFSRASFEAVTALFFLISGSALFISWVKNKKTLYAFLTALSFGLSVWSYHAERLFVPMLVVFLFIIFKPKKNLVIFFLVTAILAIPFLRLALFTPAIRERASSTSILREQSLVLGLHTSNYENFVEKVFDNDIYLVYSHWLGKYLNYFDIRFWFWKGMQFTPPGYPDLGLLYLVDLPVFLLGLYVLVRSKNKNLKALSVFWFFAGPFPASLTMNEQHPLRALTWLPFFGIVVAMGFEYITAKYKTFKIYLIYIALFLFNFIYFFDIYTHQSPRFFSEYWSYGYKESTIYACENRDKYDEIVVTDTFGSDGPLNTGLPYLYWLVYCDWDRDSFLSTGKHPEKLRFRRPNKEDFSDGKKKLLIGSSWDFLEGLCDKGKIVKTIYYLNGKEGFLLIEP